jgi:nucleoside-diphosphate-sugar epimerase
MNVFITGGTGFLGAAITEKLLAEGHLVTILSRSRQNRTARAGLSYPGLQFSVPGMRRTRRQYIKAVSARRATLLMQLQSILVRKLFF